MKRFFALIIVCFIILALMPGFASAGKDAVSVTEGQEVILASRPAQMPSLTADQRSKLYKVYNIKKGDCLISIGKRFGVSWRYIAELNGIPGPKYTIIAGKTLKIPLLPKLKGNTGNYLILCETEAQKKYLAEFAAFKTWSGFTVTVKSVEEDVKPKAKADPCEAIRQYLKKMDWKLSLEYVLLIGSPYNAESRCPQHTGGKIPMRYLYYNPSNHNTMYDCDWYDYINPNNSGFNTPTDIYYAFDFNWDYDKDGYAGEMDEVPESAKQAEPELLFLLGRIPFSDKKDIKTVLNATMQYELSRKSHSTALIGSYGDWAFYGDALAKNLTNEKIESTTIFGDDEEGPCKYESTYALSADNFNLEACKNYDFLYTMDIIDRYNFNPNPENGALAGIYFMDSFASMEVEPREGDTRLRAQHLLADGAVSAAIATTREVGFNPGNPAPKMPSLLFSNKTLCVSREFYAAVLSTIVNSSVWNNVSDAYIYCYLGDPSIELKP